MSQSRSFIRVQRPDRWFGSALTVRIFIDGVLRGELSPPAPGTASDFDLATPGRHEAFFEIDGCRSAVYETPDIKIGQFQTLEIELPEIPLYSWLFRRRNFGRLVPRSTAIANID